jgi:3-oxoacyl-[acyl-carrier-protein] synthase-3
MNTNSPECVTVCAPRYVLGEITLKHDEIEGFADFVERQRMVPDAEMWGWGTVHRTTLDLTGLAVSAGRQILRAADVEPGEVDALVLCSSGFPATIAEHGPLVSSVQRGLRLGPVPVTGVTLNRCANLLTGMQAAAALTAAGRHRTVLVITADLVAAEAERLTDFALFSDGAAGCLVTRQPARSPGSYQWVADACASDPDDLGGSVISAELARLANQRLFDETGLDVESIDGLLHNNICLPVVTMKEMQAGFAESQLDTSNITRTGHCFAADPLINLADRRSAGTIQPGGLYLLASSVPGFRACVLLRANP